MPKAFALAILVTWMSSCPAAITMTRKPLGAEDISPLQYGQFVEYLCDLVPSMWAEKLFDGGFEGLSPYKVVFIKETDFREKRWYPSGAVNRAAYAKDQAVKVSGAMSERISAADGPPCTVGISQDGIFVDRGKACEFTCHFRQEGIQGPVRVRLHHQGQVLASMEWPVTGAWKKYVKEFVPVEREVNATLTIEFRGPGTLWLDNASLLPKETVGGWRPDVVAAVRALKPGIIRFGGSALDDPQLGEFEWRDTIGDIDRRKPFRAWGGLQPTGPGLEELIQFCHYVGAEPLMCVRFSRRTPQQAAEQVQYFNGAADTPLGALRAKNGHPEPYHIKYWQVGNERAGKEYEARLGDFCQAMKLADPSIQLLSSYPSEGVLRAAGGWLDFVCPHHYGCADLPGMEKDLTHIQQLIRKSAPGRHIKIAVTEWNTTGGDWGPRRAMLWTLANALACSRYHNLLHRHADLVRIANRSNLINSFCSGIIQVDNHRLYKTPTYYAQQLYATVAGTRPLMIERSNGDVGAPDISATLSAKEDALTIFAVNDGLHEICETVDLSAFGDKGQELTVWTLTDRQGAGEPDVTNSFANPERVTPVKSKVSVPSPRFQFRFAPLSLVVIQWKVSH